MTDRSICFGLGQIRADDDAKKTQSHKDAIRAALCSGIREIDCAPNYGEGQAEILLGEVLAETEGQMDDLWINTKVGYACHLDDLKPFQCHDDKDKHWKIAHHYHCLAPEFLEWQLNQTLNRLSVDSVGTLFLHNPEEHLEAYGDRVFERRLQRALTSVARLETKGLCKRIGIAFSQDVLDFDPCDFLARLRRIATEAGVELGVLQVPFSLSLTDAIWPKSGQSSFSQMARLHDFELQGSAALGKMYLPLQTLNLLSSQLGTKGIAETALQFARNAPGFNQAIFGSSSSQHVAELAGLLGSRRDLLTGQA